MKKLFSLLGFLLLVASCGPRTTTKQNQFPLMYQEKPLSVVIVPPINETTDVQAKEYYATTIQEPLCQVGYYTLPYEITTEILKREGMYDTEAYQNQSFNQFGEFFGADAVFISRIKSWNKNYMVISSTLEVDVDCALVSTKSNTVLWSYRGRIKVDLSSSTGNPLLSIAITAFNTVVADYVPYAQQVNETIVTALPKGKYHSKFGQDGEEKVIDQRPKRSKK
jgi:hypothetical protein